MALLIKLKREVQFNQEFTQVVDVMKGIAAARFHVLQRQLALFEPYTKAVYELLSAVDLQRVDHPFVRAKTPAVGAVVVTSDAGFLGGLNTAVVNAGLAAAGAGGMLAVIGERGASAVRDAPNPCTLFPGVEDASRLSLALAVRDHMVEQVLSGVCGRLVVVYPKPVSFAVQQVTVETLLPCEALLRQRIPTAAAEEILWESHPEDVVEYVVTQWIGHRLNELFALSRLAELAARAMHLEGSYHELLRIGKRLRLQYFRARHEVIDRSMREIFAAQLLYGKTRAG
jgi:ATP synthase F1 gamma subunit